MTQLTDSSGNVIEKYIYDIFGKATITSPSNSLQPNSLFGNRFMFTGREWLNEVGLYDYRNRVYSCELGRFLQTDPIGFDGGDINLYRYCGNDVVDLIDPDGLTCESDCQFEYKKQIDLNKKLADGERKAAKLMYDTALKIFGSERDAAIELINKLPKANCSGFTGAARQFCENLDKESKVQAINAAKGVYSSAAAIALKSKDGAIKTADIGEKLGNKIASAALKACLARCKPKPKCKPKK